jgi:hypothetical protein
MGMPAGGVLSALGSADVMAGGLVGGLAASWPGTHILLPQPGQNTTLSGISA